jgi:hypothetical protein
MHNPLISDDRHLCLKFCHSAFDSAFCHSAFDSALQRWGRVQTDPQTSAKCVPCMGECLQGNLASIVVPFCGEHKHLRAVMLMFGRTSETHVLHIRVY